MKKLTCILAALVLVLVPLAVYQPSLDGGFLWDDDAHVTKNLTVQDPAGLTRIWLEPGAVPQYYPVAHTGFWLQYQLWGDWSMGYRLVNVFLHGISAFLVWLILRRLKVPGAWVAAMIFAVHPMHVETVAWISEFKNTLSGFFYLTALYVWLFFAGPLDKPAPMHRRWWLYGLFVVLFAAALLSKTVTATLPAVLLLLLWWKRPRLKMRDIGPVIPLFAIGLGFGLVTVLYEKHFVGAQGADFDFSPIDRFLIAGRALWFYATKLVWPEPLIFFYPRWVIDATSLVQYLFPLGVLAVMGLLFAFRGRLGKGPLVAVLFFAGTLMPALGFFDVYPFVYSFVANHFAYLASLGVIVLVVGSASTLSLKFGKAGVTCGRILAVLVICLLSGVTWHESHAYVDSQTLYKDIIAKNPRAWMAQNNLANLYISQQRWDEAQRYVMQSLAVNPDNDRARKTMAMVYVHLGMRDKAIEQYGRSLSINKSDATTYVALARLLVDAGRVDLAMEYLRIALRIDPSLPEAHVIMGHAWLKKDDSERALESFKVAQRLDPELAEVPAGIALVMVAQDRQLSAIRYYQDSLKLLPAQPEIHNNLATLYAQNGKEKQAVEHYRLALEENPAFLVARRNLAKTLAHMGKTQEAATEYALVLKSEPGNIDALVAVSDAHVTANELALAQAGYEKVIKLDPLNAYAHNNLGVVFMLQNEDLQAARHIENAIKISPDLVDGWFNLGLLNLKHRRIGPAGKSFAQAIKLDPDNGGAWFQMGRVHELQKQDVQAVAAYRRAMGLIPKAPAVKDRLAWLLATTDVREMRSPQEAVALATEAVKLTRNKDVDVLDTLGVALASAGEYKEAISSTKRALKLAQAAGEDDRVKLLEQRITLYKAGQPFVALPAGEAVQKPAVEREPIAAPKPAQVPVSQPAAQPTAAPAVRP